MAIGNLLSDCELVALLEDDSGMELLVCNKIISLDLPVKDVYKKIWCTRPNANNVRIYNVYIYTTQIYTRRTL